MSCCSLHFGDLASDAFELHLTHQQMGPVASLAAISPVFGASGNWEWLSLPADFPFLTEDWFQFAWGPVSPASKCSSMFSF